MHDFVRKLITEWRLVSRSGSAPIVIGLSGGADSAALVCAFGELKKSGKLEKEIIVVHFDHCLRGEESNADEEFSRNLAGSLNMAYRSGFAGENEIHGNIEQGARRARYKFMRQIAVQEGASEVLTGHTINDQAETFLMNLLRGSGTDGLAGMATRRPMKGSGGIDLVRPLLRWATREMTVQYCRDLRIDYRTDSMNEDPAYKRVRIRKELLPLLQEYNPHIVETLARTAASIRDVKNGVELLMDRNREINSMVMSPVLKVGRLKEMPSELRMLTIRRWLLNRFGNLKGISTAHLNAIADLVMSEKSGKTVELPGGRNIVKGSGSLELQDREVD